MLMLNRNTKMTEFIPETNIHLTRIIYLNINWAKSRIMQQNSHSADSSMSARLEDVLSFEDDQVASVCYKVGFTVTLHF